MSDFPHHPLFFYALKLSARLGLTSMFPFTIHRQLLPLSIGQRACYTFFCHVLELLTIFLLTYIWFIVLFIWGKNLLLILISTEFNTHNNCI